MMGFWLLAGGCVLGAMLTTLVLYCACVLSSHPEQSRSILPRTQRSAWMDMGEGYHSSPS